MLIDSRATIDAIALYAIVQADVSLRLKKEPYKLTLIDREPYSYNKGWITKETILVVIEI